MKAKTSLEFGNFPKYPENAMNNQGNLLSFPLNNCSLLTVFFEETRSHFQEGTSGVGPQTFGWFVRNLDTVLKNTDREMFRRHRRKEKSKIIVDLLRCLLHAFNEVFHGYHPTGSQVTVLKIHVIKKFNFHSTPGVNK